MIEQDEKTSQRRFSMGRIKGAEVYFENGKFTNAQNGFDLPEQLSPTQAKTLQILLRRSGDWVPRRQLFFLYVQPSEGYHPDRIEINTTVNAAIRNLRRAMKRIDPLLANRIETQVGVGYRFK